MRKCNQLLICPVLGLHLATKYSYSTSVYLSIRLSIYLSIYLSICLLVYLSYLSYLSYLNIQFPLFHSFYSILFYFIPLLTLATVLKYMTPKSPSPIKKDIAVMTISMRKFVRLNDITTVVSPTHCFQVLKRKKQKSRKREIK